MTQALNAVGKQLAGKIVATQFVVLLVASLVMITIFSLQSGLGVLSGGLSAVIPNALFAVIAFRHAGARANKKVVQSFFVGEGVKLILTAVLLVLALLVTNFNPVWLLVGFVLTVIMQWIAPILYLKST